jgi:thiaminase
MSEDEAVILQDAKTISACHSFLSNLSTDELSWMQEFRDFLLQDIDYVLNLKNNPTYFNRFRSNKEVELSESEI